MPLVLITYDEPTFNASDGKRRLWMKKDRPPVWQKGRGKEIMVSGFHTPGGWLQVPERVHSIHNDPALKMANAMVWQGQLLDW